MASRGYHLLMSGRECCGIQSIHIGGAVATPSVEKFLADDNRCKRCEDSKAGKRLIEMHNQRKAENLAT